MPRRPAESIVETGGGPAQVHAKSTEDVALAVRRALANGTTLRIAGGGTWLSAGNPVHAHTQLNIGDLRGIVDYSPGDFTLTARAATPLTTIAAVAAEHNQWLPLDPFGTPLGTLGATLATASAGPLALSIGLPRDNVLGIEVVTGDARTIRAGGKVVKNVAGFDLVRLNVGAWGTLGVLTEITVRLRPLPEVDRTLLIHLPSATPGAPWWLELRTLPSVAVACEAFTAALCTQLGLEASPMAAVRLCGNASDVAAVESLLRNLGTPRKASESFWSDVSQCEPPGTHVLRYSALPTHFDQLWNVVTSPSHNRAAHATVSRGIVRCFADVDARDLPDPSTLPFNAGVRAERGHRRHASQLPAPARALMARVQRAFDPERLLNPGILDLT